MQCNFISVPRACVRAESIVTEGDISFASIGTNDLTQLMYGFSRDDTAKFMVRLEWNLEVEC